MENEMTEWNYNVEAAPKFKTVTKLVKIKDGAKSVETKKPVKIIGCCDNPDKWVSPTYWIEPTAPETVGRWAGLAAGQELLAWTPILDHPNLRSAND
jgi:hypothetical protein